MKPSEIDEGILGSVKDAFAKKGWFGQAAKYAAYGSELDKKKQAVDDRAWQDRLNKWLVNLPVAIANAYASSLVAESAFKKNNYKKFNTLIENLILTEAPINVSDFIKQYVSKLAREYNVPITSQIQAAIDTNIADFITKFRYDPRLPPEKHVLTPDAKESATKIFNAMKIGSQVQSPDQTTVGKKFGAPKADTDIEINGIDYHYDLASKQWTTNGTPVTEPGDIDTLNKTAYAQAKNAPKPYPKPTSEVPSNASAGGTWKPTPTSQEYAFDGTDWYVGPIWRGKKIPATDTARINLLNKTYAETL